MKSYLRLIFIQRINCIFFLALLFLSSVSFSQIHINANDKSVLRINCELEVNNQKKLYPLDKLYRIIIDKTKSRKTGINIIFSIEKRTEDFAGSWIITDVSDSICLHKNSAVPKKLIIPFDAEKEKKINYIIKNVTKNCVLKYIIKFSYNIKGNKIEGVSEELQIPILTDNPDFGSINKNTEINSNQGMNSKYLQCKSVSLSNENQQDTILKYRDAINNADDLLAHLLMKESVPDTTEYYKIIRFFQNISKIEPDSSYPKIRIKEIISFLSSVQTADSFFQNNNYMLADSFYILSNKKFKTALYPKDQQLYIALNKTPCNGNKKYLIILLIILTFLLAAIIYRIRIKLRSR